MEIGSKTMDKAMTTTDVTPIGGNCVVGRTLAMTVN